MIEPGQARLSMILSRPTMLGAPEKLSGGPAIGEGGIYEGGHIDIVSPLFGRAGALACGTDCYWTSKEVWFWPLK